MKEKKLSLLFRFYQIARFYIEVFCYREKILFVDSEALGVQQRCRLLIDIISSYPEGSQNILNFIFYEGWMNRKMVLSFIKLFCSSDKSVKSVGMLCYCINLQV